MDKNIENEKEAWKKDYSLVPKKKTATFKFTVILITAMFVSNVTSRQLAAGDISIDTAAIITILLSLACLVYGFDAYAKTKIGNFIYKAWLYGSCLFRIIFGLDILFR